MFESQLDEYQEQPYLLDPQLELLLSPLITAFRNQVKLPDLQLNTPRLHRLSHLIYFFTKVRGSKTIGKSPLLRPSYPPHVASSSERGRADQGSGLLTQCRCSRTRCWTCRLSCAR